MPDDSFFANRPKKQQSLVGVPSGSLPRSPVGFSFSTVSLQIIIRSPHPRLGKFVFSDLQHYPSLCGLKSDIPSGTKCARSSHSSFGKVQLLGLQRIRKNTRRLSASHETQSRYRRAASPTHHNMPPRLTLHHSVDQ